MKSLETVQKIVRVFDVLALIAKIFTIMGLVVCLIGATLLFAVPRVIDPSIYKDLAEELGSLEPVKAGLTLIAEAIFMVGQVVAAISVCQYFKSELADGTPFTHAGARLLRKTAVIAFAAPLVAEIIASIFLLIVHAEVEMSMDITGSVVAFLLSYLLDYGADLAANQIVPDKEFL